MKRRDFFGTIAAAVAAPKFLPAGDVPPPIEEPGPAPLIASGYVFYHPVEATTFDDGERKWVMRFTK